jgi:anti-sigma B factor antagonist
MIRLTIQATPQDVMRSVAELQTFGNRQGLNQKDLYGALLALEECASNIVDHALRRDSEQTFTVKIEYDGRVLKLELRDSGPYFDPTLSTPTMANDDAVGGWGLKLVHQSMDEMHYRREGYENVLTLWKIVPMGTKINKPKNKQSTHMALEIVINRTGKENQSGPVTVKLNGSLDTATAPELERRLAPVLAAPVQDVVFDLADLQFISSAGLRVFANARKLVQARRGQASFIRMQPQILEVFAIIQSLPGIAVFECEAEFDRYISARQNAHRSEAGSQARPS